MPMHSISKSLNILLPSLICVLLSSGCAQDKKMVSPYEGRAQRETAMREQGYERPVAKQEVPEPRVSELPLDQPQVMADDDLLLPMLTHVNERIFSYEQKKAAWSALQEKIANQDLEEERLAKIAECRRQVQEILNQYNDLHYQVLQKESVTTKHLLKGELLLNLEKKDFQFLESDCSRMLSGGPAVDSPLPTKKDAVRQQEQEISTAFANGEYEKTTKDYERLMFDIAQPPPYELTFSYGQALMKTGRETDARSVFKELLNRIRQQDQAQWEFKLMQLIGDLDFALDSYSAAKDQYDEIVQIYEGLSKRNDWAKQQLSALNVADDQSEEVKTYADVLRRHLAYNPDRDGFTVVAKAEAFVDMYPYSLVASSADHLVNISRRDAEEWYQGLLQQVDALVAEDNYQDALLIMERVPRTILPVEKQQELATKSKELSTTEAIARETMQLEEEQLLQENWNTGMTALQFKEYDKAIEAFSQLLGSSYDDRAKVRIDEAAGLAAQEDRRRAAELFVRANRTEDPESRKKLLFSSRQLLQDILVKYPQSDLIEKVRRNLERIEDEISAIDPTLLSAPVTVDGAIAEPVDSSASTGLDAEF